MVVEIKKKAPSNQVRVRMYRHGLGDCFLIRTAKTDGSPFNMLIDCGLIAVAENPKETMGKVVADIRKECNDKLDVAVVTHEHWDHASGFSSQQVQNEFAQMKIGEAWYAWTEDPKSKLGTKLRKERAAKVRTLQAAAAALRNSGLTLAEERADRIESLLQFFGIHDQKSLDAEVLSAKKDEPGKSQAAFEYLAKRTDVKTRYCYPDKAPITLPDVEGLRIYVLGPPQDEGYIKRSSPTRKGKEVYEFGSDVSLDQSLGIAFERLADPNAQPGGPDCPFESSRCIVPGRSQLPQKLQDLKAKKWDPQDLAWRRIEEDWTGAAETLALNLDSHTNNTCLVLAIELVKTGRILLFAADAQVGNWLSWQQTSWKVDNGKGSLTVTGPELLQRTVFYKVGHHGSHNATLRALGLEQMSSEDLVAFVPVFKAQAEKNRWHQMPFAPLVKRLKEKTGGRLVFSDTDPPDEAQLASLSKDQAKAFVSALKVDPLYFEYSFNM